jgi:hypothetical protein
MKFVKATISNLSMNALRSLKEKKHQWVHVNRCVGITKNLKFVKAAISKCSMNASRSLKEKNTSGSV